MKKANEVIAQITWTVQDLRDGFEWMNGRIPTDKELAECAKKFSARQMVERSTEFGWDFIYNAVKETA